jgi:hypothetical protein
MISVAYAGVVSKFIMLNVIVRSVIMLNVVMLNVVAPLRLSAPSETRFIKLFTL